MRPAFQPIRVNTLFFNQSETVRHLAYAHSLALGAGLHVLHSSSDWLAGLLHLVSSVGCENIGFCVALVVRNASFFLCFLLQQDLESERAALMTRCIMAEEQLARLQHYIDTNLKR